MAQDPIEDQERKHEHRHEHHHEHHKRHHEHDSTEIHEHDSLRAAKNRLDSLFIAEVEDVDMLPDKVLHAEPLYIDLIRDLGARKGEREWNVGIGLTDRRNFDEYLTLVEYEFAPINRLGVEFEVPVTIVAKNTTDPTYILNQKSRINSFKAAVQWSFYVSKKNSMSMALGYINEVTFAPFKTFRTEPLIRGNIFNPFFIAAKRWGTNFHTLVYAGPHIEIDRFEAHPHTEWNVNSNFHYLLPGTRNFIGVEVNKFFTSTSSDYVIRPQMRLGLADNLLVGVVTGIPINREKERLSFFLRLIYEPHAR